MLASRKVEFIPTEIVRAEFAKKMELEKSQGEDPSLIEANRAFSEGKKFYELSNFVEAVKSLDFAYEAYIKGIAAIRDDTPIQKTNIYRALSLMALGQEGKAKLAFEEILKFNYNVQLDTKLFSPKAIQFFEKVKREVAIYDKSMLRITSDPDDVSIYLNGRKVGEARSNIPVIVGNVLPGRHYLTAEKSGYKPLFKTFITNKGELTIQAKLETADITSSFQPFALRPGEDFVNAMTEVKQTPALDSELALLCAIVKEGNDYKLKVQLFDIRTGVYTKTFKYKIGDSLRTPGESVEKLAAVLLSHLDASGMLKEEPVGPGEGGSATQAAPVATDAPLPGSVDTTFEDKPKLVPKSGFSEGTKISDIESTDSINYDTKKAVAWTVLGILLLGGAVGGYFLYQSTSGTASVSVFAP
jgi:tetratricopeptide (TPR) repeat protein